MRGLVTDYFLDFVLRIQEEDRDLALVLGGLDLKAFFEALTDYQDALLAFDTARATPLAQESPYKQVSMEFAKAIDRRLKAQAKLMKFVKDVMRKVRA